MELSILNLFMNPFSPLLTRPYNGIRCMLVGKLANPVCFPVPPAPKSSDKRQTNKRTDGRTWLLSESSACHLKKWCSSMLQVYVVIFSVVVLIFAVTILCYIRRINPYIHSQTQVGEYPQVHSGPPSTSGSSLGQVRKTK